MVSAFDGSYLMIGTEEAACLRPLVSHLRHYRPMGNGKGGDGRNLWLRLSELLRLSAWLPPGLALVWLATLATLIHNVGVALAAWGATVSLVVVVVVLVVLLTQRRHDPPRETPPNSTARQTDPAEEVPDNMAQPTTGMKGEPESTSRHPRLTGQPEPQPSNTDLFLSELRILTAEEVASVLRVDTRQVIRSISNGELPGNRLGRHWRVDRGALMRWLQGPYGDLAGTIPIAKRTLPTSARPPIRSKSARFSRLAAGLPGRRTGQR